MIFVLFLIDLLAFVGFIWLLIMYLQIQYGDRKTVKNIIPYMFTSLIVFCIGIFGVKIFSSIDLYSIDFGSIEYSYSSNNESASDSGHTKKTEIKNVVHKKKKVNPNIIKIKAIDSSNYTYHKDGIITSNNTDNTIYFNVITNKPVNLSYKIDDSSEAQVTSFQKENDNEYSVSIKMLKTSKNDIGTNINIYYTNNGYHGKTYFELGNNTYNNIDSGNNTKSDKPDSDDAKKFKSWVDDGNGNFYDTIVTDQGPISDASYDEDSNTVDVTIELEKDFVDIKSEMKATVSQITRKAQKYNVDPDDLIINFHDEDNNDLVASKQKDSSLVFYKAFYKDDNDD